MAELCCTANCVCALPFVAAHVLFRYRLELSFGLAWAQTLVVSACPSVCDISVIGAPPSIAWLAWACRSQWADAAGLIPAHLAAAFTM
jgi:hypothetical protein